MAGWVEFFVAVWGLLQTPAVIVLALPAGILAKWFPRAIAVIPLVVVVMMVARYTLSPWDHISSDILGDASLIATASAAAAFIWFGVGAVAAELFDAIKRPKPTSKAPVVKFLTFEGEPAALAPSGGWVFRDGAWKPFNESELRFNAGVLPDEAAFRRRFGSLPPLPPETDEPEGFSQSPEQTRGRP
jgi:hypothetical protein